MDILFYQGTYAPDTEPVLGTIIKQEGEEVSILYNGVLYERLIEDTRRPWDPKFWEFYKAKDFPYSPWFHGGVILWFFLFIY